MPKQKQLTQFPAGYANWNYNWGLIYVQAYMDAGGLRRMYGDEQRFQAGNIPAVVEMTMGVNEETGQPVEYLLDDDDNKRPCPSLIYSQKELKVSCKTKFGEQSEYKEVQAEHENSLRKRLSAYCSAVDEKQTQMAVYNPEGASFLRFRRDMVNFALQNYGSEAMSDDVYATIHSQTATIHTPDGLEADPQKKDFTYLMDQLSDMPFLPVFENATRMVSIACDHANAAKAGTLTLQQDRLSRRLLLTQYDHVSGGLLESKRIVRDDDASVAEDYQRWAKAMDNRPVHVSTGERAPLFAPDNLEGRRIALRQGWPVQDAALLGSLFEIQARRLRPTPNDKRKFEPETMKSLAKMLQEIGATRITDQKSRMDMLDRIETYFTKNAKKLDLPTDRLKLCFQLRRADQIQPCQYLNEKELDAAAQDYKRRKTLPQVAGSDRSPTGYYEQALAGTEVLSRLDSLYQIMAPQNQDGEDVPEYAFLRDGLSKQIGMISAFYGPDAPIGMERENQMQRIEAAHDALIDLAKTYLDQVSTDDTEPAFKKDAVRKLRDYCAGVVQTAQATEIGMEEAEKRRAGLAWRQKKDRDKNAYQKYLDEIWAAYLDAMDAPKEDPYNYMAVAERGLKIESLNAKFDPLLKIFLQNGLSPEQISTLMAKAFPQKEADQLVEKITRDFLSESANAINNLVLEGKLARQSATLVLGWNNLPEKTRKEKIAEGIRGMLDGKFFDRGVFTNYATPEQKLAITKKLMSPGQLRRIYITMMDRALTYRSKERDRLRVYRYLPEVLSSDELHTLVRDLDAAPILHDRAEQTFLREKERREIEKTRQHMETTLADNPSLLEEARNALKDAETILSRGTEEAQRVTEAKESVCTSALNAYAEIAFAKEKAKAPGERADRCGPVVEFQGNDVLPEATTEGVRKILQMPKLPDKFRNSILKMLHKMDEMELLPKDMTDAAVEQGAKTYAYIQIGNAKKTYSDIILSANPDPVALIEARKNYETAYQNMKELLQLAEEGFGSERTNAPDMFVTRQQYGFPWELVNTPHQGQINTVFLMYQQMRLYKMTPEQFLDGMPRTLIQPWQEVLYKTRESQGLTGKDLAADLNVIMRPNAHEVYDGWKHFPPDRFIGEFWKMLDNHDESFDRDGFVAWTNDATNLIRDILGRERARIEVFCRHTFKPNFVEMRNQSLQNLITVADEDRDYNLITGLPTYNKDLEITPFSLDDYIRSHSIDPAAMERRLNIIIDAAKKYPRAPYLEEVVTAGVAACTKVLTLRYAERDTEPYRALEALTERIVSRFPSVHDVTFVQKELEDAGMDSTDVKDQMMRARNLPQIRARMEQYLRRYNEFLENPQEIQSGEKPVGGKAEEPKVEEPEIGSAAGDKPKEAEILSGSSEAAGEETESKPEVTIGSHPTAPVFVEPIFEEKASQEKSSEEKAPEENPIVEEEKPVEEEFSQEKSSEEKGPGENPAVEDGKSAEERPAAEAPKVEAPVPADPVLLQREQIQNRMILADKDREMAAQSAFSLDEYIRTHEIYPFHLEQRLNAMIAASEQPGDGPSREELLETGLDACLRVLYRKQLERGSERYQGLEKLAKSLLERMPKEQGPGKERRDRMQQSLNRYETFLATPSLDELTRELRNAHVPPKSNMGFEGLRASVQSLSELSASLLRPGEDGRSQVLSAQSREDLKHAYQAVINTAAAFRSFAEDDPNLAQARAQAEKISRLAARDMNILTGARGADALTLAQVYERRSPTLDVSNVKAQTVGSVTSQRLAFQIPVGNGKVLDGFFTPEQPLPSAEDERAALWQRIVKASPDAARAVRLMEEKSGSFRDHENQQITGLWAWQKKQKMKTLDCREYDHRYDSFLLEAGLSSAQIDRITNKSFSDAIDDYVLGQAQIRTRNILTGEMDIKPGDPMELRNGAMSAVADALGIGALLAASRPITLTKNGKAVRGIFMERAVGSDLNHPGENDPILEMSADTPLSPKALRELASIHVLDFICGNVDRHCGNLLYQFKRDESNKVVLDGVQGIDNDLSFMACSAEKGITATQMLAEELQTMPQSLAERVLLLDPGFLKCSLREFRLPEDQLDRAAERLGVVQERIRSGLEYFKDKEPGATSDDHIHVLPDDDYGKLSKETAHLISAKSGISAVSGFAKNAKLEQEMIAPRTAFREDGRKLAELFTQALISDEKLLYVSKEFAAMRDALYEVGKKHRALAKPNEEELARNKTMHKPTEEELREIRRSYNKLDEAARIYLQGKEQLRQRKGEASLNENTRVRMGLARRILEQINPQLEHINKLPESLAAEERLIQSQKAVQLSETPTARERLSGLLRLLEEQRLQYAAALRGCASGQKQEELLNPEALGNTLMEAFAVAELGTAAGPDVKADDRRVKLMRDVLKTDRKKQFGTYDSCLKALSENIPEVKTNHLHQAAYQDLRDAVSLAVAESDKLPERLETLSGILKDPEHFQKRVSDFVIAAEQERKNDAPQKKNKRGTGKLGL